MTEYKPYPEDRPYRLEVMRDGARIGTIYVQFGCFLEEDCPCLWFTKTTKNPRKFPTLAKAKAFIEAG